MKRPVRHNILCRHCVDFTHCRFIQPYPVMTWHDFYRLNPRALYNKQSSRAAEYVNTIILRINVQIHSRPPQLCLLMCSLHSLSMRRMNQKMFVCQTDPLIPTQSAPLCQHFFTIVSAENDKSQWYHYRSVGLLQLCCLFRYPGLTLSSDSLMLFHYLSISLRVQP